MAFSQPAKPTSADPRKDLLYFCFDISLFSISNILIILIYLHTCNLYKDKIYDKKNSGIPLYFVTACNIGSPKLDFQWHIFLAINVMLQLTQSVGNIPLTSEKHFAYLVNSKFQEKVRFETN